MKREIVIELEKELDKYLEDMGIKRLYADKPAIIAEIKSAFFAGARTLNYIQENKKRVRVWRPSKNCGLSSAYSSEEREDKE